MNNVKEHYQKHLAGFYSWMAGDFESLQTEHQQFLESHKLFPKLSKVAIDMGSGHGIQSVSLAKLGYNVTAIDSNLHLLTELKINGAELKITTVMDDIKNAAAYGHLQPELITCWGDTLTHLANLKEIEKFLIDCCAILSDGGILMLNFRDYSQKLIGDERFLHVKSDKNRVLTCFLEFLPTQVRVTDLLNEQTPNGCRQKISSYYKFRITKEEVVETLKSIPMKLCFEGKNEGSYTIIAQK